MSHWENIRAEARAQHAVLARQAGNDPRPVAVLSAAETESGITSIGLPAGHALLYGSAEAALHAGIIWYNQDAPIGLQLLARAHEYAHLRLHGATTSVCTEADFTTEQVDENLAVGAQRVEGYGPHERRELECNVYAREILLPCPLLRTWFLEDGLNASSIAAHTQLPEGLVHHQLTHALLGPDPKGDQEPVEQRSEPELDDSQRDAAQAEAGPVLVQAGPGTGKTRTLVARVTFLLDNQKVAAENILALTFSNKAAEELHERVSRSVPEAASSLWTGTFHAFGLELLRKYGTKLGLPPKPVVINPIDALVLLDDSLSDLHLDHYQDLYEPARHLRSVLNAISRAKDELVGPERYRELADEMHRRATTAADLERAEKAQEVARVYAFYQGRLAREGSLDYGDLIARTVRPLQENPDVRDAIQKQYRHILVDEYQDVNRASRIMLREMVAGGEGLWVVGDLRQAVYRFRGAAPTNMQLFSRDYPAARTLSLKVNYRSQPMIVSLFSGFAKTMSNAAVAGFSNWKADRLATTGAICYQVGDDERDEGLAIATEIRRRANSGVRYRDQAVLCRGHASLATIATVLAEQRVPVFYLGDVFERPEVRDLLALIQFCSEKNGRALLRLASLPEYNVPEQDLVTVWKLAKEKEVAFPGGLSSLAAEAQISDAGKQALGTLADQIKAIHYGTSAWTALVTYLFETSSYLRQLCQESTPIGGQKRLAINQLLQFAYSLRGRCRPGRHDPKRSFLEHIRRLEIWGEERQLRQLPAWASQIDAVPMLTVHASKGLQFPVVYLPHLVTTRFPSSDRWNACEPPIGLIEDAEENGHGEGEECLFFVGMSRAQDVLHLSRFARQGGKNRSQSEFLTRLGSYLPAPRTVHSDNSPNVNVTGAPVRRLDRPYSSRELDVYKNCPFQF